MNRLLLAATLAIASPSFAALSVQRHVLDNGLIVLLHEDHKLPLVTSYVWYKVGSRDEGPGKSGFAHLFEHFMFEGSEHVPNGYHFAFAFGNGGVANASTSFDRTYYFFTMPSQHLEEQLRVESDRMGFLEAAMTEPSFVKQREIVLNEKRQGDNQPYHEAGSALFRDTFPADHPYAKTPIGSEADLNAATVEDAKKFHTRYYWPNNAVLVLSGDFESAQALAMVQKWFGPLKAGPVPPAPVDLPGGPRYPRQILVDSKAPGPRLLMAWKIPGVGQPGHDELVAIASLLTDGRASRLYDALVVRRPVLLEVEAGVANLQYGDMFQIDAKPADGVSLAEAEKAITAEMDGFFAADVDPAKIKALAAKAEANRFRALQDAHELANALADGEARLGDPLAIVNAGDNLRKMTPESLRKAGAAALVPSARAVIGIVPPGEIK